MSQESVEIIKTAVVQLRDGLAVRLDYYNNREQALQQVGLKARDEPAQST